MRQVQQLTREKDQAVREKEEIGTRLVREKNQVVCEKDHLVRENYQLHQSQLQVQLIL